MVKQRTRNIEDARTIFEAAVKAVTPAPRSFSVLNALSDNPGSDLHIVGLGKAALVMAQAAWLSSGYADGMVTIPHTYAERNDEQIDEYRGRLQVLVGDHPYPAERSHAAVLATMDWIKSLSTVDPIAVLISGGGSALWGHPIPGISQARYRQIVKRLVDGGDDIRRVNLLRRHLNILGGGGLRVALGQRRVASFILSDVPGDDLSIVASGPMSLPSRDEVENVTAYCRELVGRGVLKSTETEFVLRCVARKAESAIASGDFHLVGSNRIALEAAYENAASLGYQPAISKQPISGDAATFGSKVLVTEAASLSQGECLLFGGESTVTVRGSGRGGRNQEMALAAALELKERGIEATILVAGTDGIDGPTDAAGAIVDGSTVEEIESIGRSATRSLENNDSYAFFCDTKSHLITGPTHTNVMDIAIVLVA